MPHIFIFLLLNLCLQVSVEVSELIYNSYSKFGSISNEKIEKMRLNERLRVVQGLEDTARRSVIRSLVSDTAFGTKELEELYLLFKVIELVILKR